MVKSICKKLHKYRQKTLEEKVDKYIYQKLSLIR